MTTRAQDDAGIVAAVEAHAKIENEARSSMDPHGLYAEEAAAARAALFAAIDAWASENAERWAASLITGTVVRVPASMPSDQRMSILEQLQAFAVGSVAVVAVEPPWSVAESTDPVTQSAVQAVIDDVRAGRFPR